MKATMWIMAVILTCCWNECSSCNSSPTAAPATIAPRPPVHNFICDGHGFTMKSRKDWGARPAKNGGDRLRTPVPEVVIHHTDSFWRSLNLGGYNDEQEYIARVKEIQDDHMDNEGFDDIGYNFLIDGYGNVYEGRGWDTKGAHVYKANSGKIGISFIGYFENDLPTPAALRAGRNLIACGEEKKKLRMFYTVSCHSDFGSAGGNTDCPGNALCRYSKGN